MRWSSTRRNSGSSSGPSGTERAGRGLLAGWRATAGWRGARAHYIQLLGFASLVTNMLIVQVFITGLHSYAGVT